MRTRVPTIMQDDLKIFCKTMRDKGETYKNIAFMIGKDHTTVIHHVKKFNDLSEVDKKFQQRIKDFSLSNFILEYGNYVKKRIRKKGGYYQNLANILKM